MLLQISYIESDVVDAITEQHVTYGKLTIVCTIGGGFTQMLVKMLEENHRPSYVTLERAVNVINALVISQSVKRHREEKNRITGTDSELCASSKIFSAHMCLHLCFKSINKSSVVRLLR